MKWQLYTAFRLLSGALAEDVFELPSPSGKLNLVFSLSDTKRPTYSLTLDGVSVIEPSGLGLEFYNRTDPENVVSDDFTSGFELIPDNPLEGPNEFDETWYPIWGEESQIQDHHNQMLVHLVQPGLNGIDRFLDIRFRMFDEGLGFRYEFPQQPNLVYYDVLEEHTEFRMTGNHRAWWIAGDYDTQEYNYMETDISEIREKFNDAVEEGNASQTPFEGGVQTAFQMKTHDDPPIYINIHEAALVNYSAMHLEIDDTALVFRSHLTPDAVGVKAHLQAPNTSPWRTIIASTDPRDMLRSRITYNLNEPPKGDFSWVKPVKYMGVWWEMITGFGAWSYTDAFPSVQLGITDYESAEGHGRHSANTKRVKDYLDFAGEHGFDALLVEGWNIGWEDWFGHGKDYVFDFLTPYPDFNVTELVEYAAAKNMQLMMHHETSGSTRNYERHMDRAYQFMKDHNYGSVKSGYVGNMLPHGQHHYSQDMVNHYLYAVQKAAEYEICVNAHEAVRPTGLARTYPNMLANEAARGQEYQAFAGSPPDHVAILPFTRLIGGPMDYTPGIFKHDLYNWVPGDHGETWRVQSTISQQLGLYVTMYSPLQMAADLFTHYEAHVDGAFKFIKDVPVDWEKSVYIEAEPKAYLTIARLDKAGKANWFIGHVYGGIRSGRVSRFTLDFLEDTCYNATIYHDVQYPEDGLPTHYWTNPELYAIESRFVHRDEEFEQWAAPGGGFAVSLVRLDPECESTTSTTTEAPPTSSAVEGSLETEASGETSETEASGETWETEASGETLETETSTTRSTTRSTTTPTTTSTPTTKDTSGAASMLGISFAALAVMYSFI